MLVLRRYGSYSCHNWVFFRFLVLLLMMMMLMNLLTHSWKLFKLLTNLVVDYSTEEKSHEQVVQLIAQIIE